VYVSVRTLLLRHISSLSSTLVFTILGSRGEKITVQLCGFRSQRKILDKGFKMSTDLKKKLVELFVMCPALAAAYGVQQATSNTLLAMLAMGATGSALILLFTLIETRGGERPNLASFLVATLVVGSIPYILMGLIAVGFFLLAYGSLFFLLIFLHPVETFFLVVASYLVFTGLRAVIKRFITQQKLRAKTVPRS
jgi:hypothetical protein